MFSYHAQFSRPSKIDNFAHKEHHAIHKILHMPPNSMPRPLMKSVSLCSVVTPVWLDPYFNAVLLRFASSEREYLFNLDAEAKSLAGSSRTLRQFARDRLPIGNLDTVPILQNLIDALHLSGPFSSLKGREDELELNSRVRIKGPDGRFPKEPGRQAMLMRALLPPFVLPDIACLLVTKLKVTLTPELFDLCNEFLGNFQWLTHLIAIMQEVKIHCRLVWWKTVCGAWTTSHRLHEVNQLPCIFGCTDSKDTLSHYLVCPVLWQLAREVCPNEESSSVPSRLCMNLPCKVCLLRLSIAFGIYHSIKNDAVCSLSGSPSSALVQSRAVGFAKSLASTLQ